MSIQTSPDELLERLQRAPESVLFARAAEALRREGRFEEAIGLCQRGLSLHPRHTVGRLVHSRCLRDMDRLDEAKRQYEALLQDDPRCLSALKELGQVLRLLSWEGPAKDCFQRLRALDPWDAEVASFLPPEAAVQMSAPGAFAAARPETASPLAEPFGESFPEGMDGSALEPSLGLAEAEALPGFEEPGRMADFLPADGVEERLDQLFEEEGPQGSGPVLTGDFEGPQRSGDLAPAEESLSDLRLLEDEAAIPARPEEDFTGVGSAESLLETESQLLDLADHTTYEPVQNPDLLVSGEDIENRLDDLFPADAPEPAPSLAPPDLEIPARNADKTAEVSSELLLESAKTRIEDAFLDRAGDSAIRPAEALRPADSQITENFRITEEFAPSASPVEAAPAETASGPGPSGDEVAAHLETLFAEPGSRDLPAQSPAAEAAATGEAAPAFPAEETEAEKEAEPGLFETGTWSAALPAAGDTQAAPLPAGAEAVSGLEVERKLEELFGDDAPKALSPAASESGIFSAASQSGFFGEAGEATMMLPILPEAPREAEEIGSRAEDLPGPSAEEEELLGLARETMSIPNAEGGSDRGLVLEDELGAGSDTHTYEMRASTLETREDTETLRLSDFKEGVVEASDVGARLDEMFGADKTTAARLDPPPEAPQDPLAALSGESAKSALFTHDEIGLPGAQGDAAPVLSGDDVSRRLEELFAEGPLTPSTPPSAGPEPRHEDSASPLDSQIFSPRDLAPGDSPGAGEDGPSSEEVLLEEGMATQIHPRIELPSGEDIPQVQGLENFSAPPALEDEDEAEAEERSAAPGEVAGTHPSTVTLAEIYFSQGLKEHSLQIYRELLEREPDNDKVRQRIQEIEASKAEEGQDGEGENAVPRRPPRPGRWGRRK